MRKRSGPRPPRRSGPEQPAVEVPGRFGLRTDLFLRSLKQPAFVVVVVLALIFLVGWLRLIRYSEGPIASLQDSGLWPVGFGAGLAVLAVGRRQRAAAVAAVVLITLAACLMTGLTDGTAVAWAGAAGAEAWVLARMVARDASGRARLADDGELGKLLLAAAVAAGVGAAVAALAGAVGVGEASPRQVASVLPVIAVSHMLSHVLVVPFFMKVPQEPPTAGRGEIVLQAALATLVTGLVFVVNFPGTLWLVFPLLAWGATRCGFRIAHVQTVLLGVVATELSIRGVGPFAAEQPELALPMVDVLLLQGYVLSAAAVTLPLAIAIAVQHRRADEVLEERQRAEGLVRSTVGTAIIATDLTGTVSLANPGAVDLFGYDAATLASLSVAELFGEGEVAEQARALGVAPELGAVMEAMSATPGERRECVVRRADGESRAHLLGFAHLTDEHGRVTGFVLTSEDITERIRMHESLVTALAAEHALVQRLEELDGVKEALVSTVSHELRTPITSIQGFIEMLQDGDYGELTSAQAEAVERVSSNSGRLLTLINDLLALARTESGAMDFDLQPIDLRDTVRTAWQVLEPRLHGRELAVSVQLTDGPAMLEGDEDQLERLVVNLIGNAIKFTPDGGRIVVRLTQEGERLGLEVSDTGIGVPQDEQSQLFSRFFRSRLASEHAIQGTGLGLSIVKAVAERHGGTVTARSQPGEGTTFRVELAASDPAGLGGHTAPCRDEPEPESPTGPVSIEELLATMPSADLPPAETAPADLAAADEPVGASGGEHSLGVLARPGTAPRLDRSSRRNI